MIDNLQENDESQNDLLNGTDIPILEVKKIHQSLLEQCERIEQEILDSVNRNDYVMLCQLIIRRKNIQTAIEDIKTFYADAWDTPQTFRGHLASRLNEIAHFMEGNGEGLLRTISETLEGFNQSSYTIAIKTVEAANESFTFCNQLSHKVGSFIVNQTATGLLKIADAIKKESEINYSRTENDYL